MTLIQRGHALRWGHAIPARLRSRFELGNILQKSLTTRDRLLARGFAQYLSEAAISLFRLVDTFPQLTRRELGLLADNLKGLTETVTLRDGSRHEGRHLEQDLTSRHDPKFALDLDRPAIVALRARLKLAVRDIDRVVGDGGNDTKQNARGHRKLSDVMVEFLKERRLNSVIHTMELRRSCLRAFMLIVGDKPIGEVERSDLANFKATVQKLPVRWERTYPGVPIAEILEKRDSSPQLQPGSVNNYLAVAHTFFEWAHVHGYVSFNPARKLQIKIRRRPQDERKRLYAGDLKQIFEESLYFKRSSHPAAIAERKRDPQVYHSFWIPLVALFSGLRAAEIIGLERQDIRRESNIWCLVVRPNGFRHIKSMSAQRIVPIHPTLLELGFVEAIERQGLEPQEWIWTGLPRESRRVGGAYARQWSQYRKTAGIDDPRKTFHSFRHSFIHALSEIEKRFDVVAELAGHSMKSEFYGRYHKSYDAPVLLRTIRKISFPVRLKHLIT